MNQPSQEQLEKALGNFYKQADMAAESSKSKHPEKLTMPFGWEVCDKGYEDQQEEKARRGVVEVFEIVGRAA